jgi:hypothetical protein
MTRHQDSGCRQSIAARQGGIAVFRVPGIPITANAKQSLISSAAAMLRRVIITLVVGVESLQDEAASLLF